MLVAGLILGFISVALFAWLGMQLLFRKWQSYEQRYLQQMGKSLDDLCLLVPPEPLLYASFVCALGAAAGGLVLFSSPIPTVVAAGGAFFLPRLILRWVRIARNNRFQKQLPELLTLVGNALKSGNSLPTSLTMACRQMKKPMSQELGLVLAEFNLGVPVEKALSNMARRMPAEELLLFVASVAVSETTGGNLCKALENVERTVRERLRLKSKMDALTSHGKIEAVIMAATPFFLAIAIHLISPGLLKPMYMTTIGIVVSLGSIAWMILGFAVMRMILTPKF